MNWCWCWISPIGWTAQTLQKGHPAPGMRGWSLPGPAPEHEDLANTNTHLATGTFEWRRHWRTASIPVGLGWLVCRFVPVGLTLSSPAEYSKPLPCESCFVMMATMVSMVSPRSQCDHDHTDYDNQWQIVIILTPIMMIASMVTTYSQHDEDNVTKKKMITLKW